MRKLPTFILASVLGVGSYSLTGCDRTVAEQTKSSTDSNGNTKSETKTVTQDSQGNTTVSQEKQTSTVK